MTCCNILTLRNVIVALCISVPLYGCGFYPRTVSETNPPLPSEQPVDADNDDNDDNNDAILKDSACPATEDTNETEDTEEKIDTAPTTELTITDFIDQFEDNDTSIIPINGRQGQWYTFGDGTGNMCPRPNDLKPTQDNRPHSSYKLCVSGSGFNTWGAGIGTDLNNIKQRSPWDASKFQGIEFAAKGFGDVRVNILTASAPPNPHGIMLQLTSHWKVYHVKFTEVTQEDWGPTTYFDTYKITGIQFQFPAESKFDACFDDIGLF